MKIGPNAEKPVSHPVTPGAQPGADAAKTPAAGASATLTDAGAKIELSSTASTLLSSGVSAEFDAQKVARISQAIASGSFKIDPEAIADKLISNAQELLTQAKG